MKNEIRYEIPDDKDLHIRSQMHTDLLISLQLKENLKIISDMAFEAIDQDGSGGLDSSEIH